MPNRILKESICTSDNIDQLSAFQETVFYRLLVNCDDYGRMDARPKILASKLFPLKDIRAAQIEDALRALSSAELVILYTVDGKPFLQMRTWDRHQAIRAKKSRYPSPDDADLQADESRCEQMISDESKCLRNPIQSNPNPNPNASINARAKSFVPPSVEEVEAYCRERKNGISPQRFIDYYETRGWMLGKTKMKDWKAAVRTWERGSEKKGHGFGDPVEAEELNAFMGV